MLNPLPASKWNYATAAHLLNRAGFGGPPAEVEKILTLGPEKAVSFFVDYEGVPDNTAAPEWAKPDPEFSRKMVELRETRRKSQTASGEEKKALEEKARMLQRQQIRNQVQ